MFGEGQIGDYILGRSVQHLNEKFRPNERTPLSNGVVSYKYRTVAVIEEELIRL
jgi:hypothetical protein